MKEKSRLAQTLMFVSIFSATTVGAAQQRGPYRDIAVPPAAIGVYPITPAALTDSRNFQKRAELRHHAWALFAGISAPSDKAKVSGDPIWTTWYTPSEALSPLCSETSANPIRQQLEFRMPMEIVADFAARRQDSMKDAVAFFSSPTETAARSAILYNKAACTHIHDRGLLNSKGGRSDELEWLKGRNAPPEEMDIKQFPADSIVIKTLWARVDSGGRTLCLSEPSDPSASHCNQPGMQEMLVMPSKSKAPCTMEPGRSVPTSCFYSITVTRLNRGELSRSMTVQRGDVLILLGIHVITKEVSDWVWSTFWWQVGQDSKGFAGDRPPGLFNQPWNNYAMDVTLSMETPHENESLDTDVPSSVKCRSRGTRNAKICFNPYLEGKLDQGQVSNCINCHKEATYPRMVPDPSGTVQRGYLGSDDQCFVGKERPVVRVDYLWSLSPPESNSPLQTFLGNLLKSLKIDVRDAK